MTTFPQVRPSRAVRGACRVLFLAALGAAASLASAARPQPPAEPPPVQLPPTVTVEIVRIEVVVTEKRGRKATGLTRDDFVVLEDGQPQTLSNFEAVGTKAVPGASVPAPVVPEPEADEPDVPMEASPLAPPRRYIVVAVDDLHTEAASLSRIKKALSRFLETDVGPDDLVALVTTSGGGRASQDFTNERAALQQAVLRLGARQVVTSWMGVPHLTDYQAELIERGDLLALEAAVLEIQQQGLFQDQASAEDLARHAARAVYTEAVHHSRMTLETLHSVMRGLEGLEGRKAILMVSDGFLTGLATGSGAGFDLRRITDAGTRSGVVIYTLDSQGLRASPPAASASSTMRVGPQTVGTLVAIQNAGEEATRDAMHTLAADTGGFLVQNSNDLRAGLRRMLQDTESYYVLAYEPTNTRHDGSFRRIEVRVKGSKDLKVRTRAGYFAPDARAAQGGVGVARAEAVRAEQREAAMKTALQALAPLPGIPLRLSADFVGGEGGRPSVVVSSHVDVRAVPFVELDGQKRATVDMRAVVLDEGGEVAATLDERAALSLTASDHEKALRSGLQYHNAAVVPPGRYQVRLAVRDEASGRLGSASEWVQVPDIAPGQFGVSSLFLLREGEGPAGGGSAAGPELRSAQALRRYRRAESLYAQIYAYNPRRDASGTASVFAQVEILKGGVVLGTAAPESVVSDGQGTSLAHTTRVRLQRFDPGDYELRLTVTDRLANAFVARQVSFAIE